jgi:curved DNA-binding protein CbpA
MDSSLQKDFYALLGVARDATSKQIKQRFRELARDRHPDRFSGEEKARAEVEFQEITEAFNVLNDPVRRRQVDLFLARPDKKREEGPGEIVRVFMNRGIRAYKQGNLIEAANNFDRASNVDPQNPQAWHHLALTCVREKRWLSKAQEAIERACELRPDHAPYLKLAGKIYAESGMTPRAKQYYNQALKLAKNDASIRKALEELGGGPAVGEPKQPVADKPGLFRKIW